MGDRCDDCTWMKHSEWILRSVESLQDEQEKQGALLREIGTNIRIVVKVAKALGYLLGIATNNQLPIKELRSKRCSCSYI